MLDLTGNVWEWVSDRFGPYTREESRAPGGPMEGAERVLRGGAWLNDTQFLRCTDRIHCRPERRHCSFGPVGFREVALE
jgi:formylglycine-generating enzyme required for sulfatase activity